MVERTASQKFYNVLLNLVSTLLNSTLNFIIHIWPKKKSLVSQSSLQLQYNYSSKNDIQETMKSFKIVIISVSILWELHTYNPIAQYFVA